MLLKDSEARDIHHWWAVYQYVSGSAIALNHLCWWLAISKKVTWCSDDVYLMLDWRHQICSFTSLSYTGKVNLFYLPALLLLLSFLIRLIIPASRFDLVSGDIRAGWFPQLLPLDWVWGMCDLVHKNNCWLSSSAIIRTSHSGYFLGHFVSCHNQNNSRTSLEHYYSRLSGIIFQ